MRWPASPLTCGNDLQYILGFRGLIVTNHVSCRCRVDFRLAKLSARKESAQAYRQERRLFVQSFALPNSSVDPTEHSPAVHAPAPLPTRHQIQKAQLSSLSEKDRQTVGASSRATEALRQMHASLQSELERSEYANQTMTESTATFNQLSESYNSLETMLGNSKDLLGSLLRSQKSDTWYLKTSLYLLAGSFAWLVFRRFLYGPLWWFAWLPLRFIFSVGSRVSRVALQGRGKGGEERPGAGGSSGTEGRVSVDGLPGEDLPTAQVGQDTGHNTDEPGSMAEKIGQIIDKVQEADEEGLIPEEPESEAEVIHNSPEMEEIRPRDEL